MKQVKKQKGLLLFLIFAVCLLVIIAILTKSQIKRKTVLNKTIIGNTESKSERAAIVKIQKINKSDYQDIISGVTGKIDVARAKLSFQIDGVVSALPFDKGDFVKKGNILAELDKEDLLLKLAYKQNSLENAKVELEKAEKALSDNKAKAQTGYILENKIKDFELEIKLKKGKVEAAELEIEAAEKNLKKAELYAPFDGVILERKIELGENVSNNREAFILLDINNTFADIEINERKIEKIEPGQNIRFKTNIFKEVIKGKIHKIVPAVQGKAMVLSARAKLEPTNLTLVAGMYGDVDITVYQANDVIVVPIKALFKDEKNTFVYTMKDEKAVRQVVTTGYITEEEAIIQKGLEIGDNVIIETTSPLKDGTKVKEEL